MNASPNAASLAPQSGALRDKLIELEYSYLTESSFRSDELRDRIFQFYLLIVSTASAVILGLFQFTKPDAGAGLPLDTGTFRWALGGLALMIGIIGILMIPIFVRLRRVVLECFQGTVLIKNYVLSTANEERLNNAFIWDDQTLPRDESYGSASFLLVLVFMILDTLMVTLPVYLLLFELYRPLTAFLATLLVFTPILTVQVLLYRFLLWRQLIGAMAHSRFRDKWTSLGIAAPPNMQPTLKEPLLRASIVGTMVFIVILILLILLDFFPLPL